MSAATCLDQDAGTGLWTATDAWGHRWTLDGGLWRETLPGQGGPGATYPPDTFAQYAAHDSQLAPHLEAITRLTAGAREPRNLCEMCGVDMGDCNPRQLCGKTYCREIEDVEN